MPARQTGRAMRLALRALAAAALVTALAACSTTGRSFDTSGMDRIIPGQTTLEQASAILKADPENVYRQGDGSVMARWAHKATLVTDAVYFRRELWLNFGNDGRFQRVVERLNVQGEPGAAPGAALQAQSSPGTGQLDSGLPRAVPTGFPYDSSSFDGPVVIYPVR